MSTPTDTAASTDAPLTDTRFVPRILFPAPDHHVIERGDAIDVPVGCRGKTLLAPQLAENVPNAIGQPAKLYNSSGLKVWMPRPAIVDGGRIIACALKNDFSKEAA